MPNPLDRIFARQLEFVQIGAPAEKTILQFIQELSQREAQQIEQLKQAATQRTQRKPGRRCFRRSPSS